jgi:hypothetical protein
MSQKIRQLSFLLTTLLVIASCDALETAPDDETTDGLTGQVEGFDPESDIYFLILDEDAIDNGDRYWKGGETVFDASTIISFSDNDVNDDKSDLARRNQLSFFQKNAGETIWLWSGQVGDEGWFAPKTIPGSWAQAGPTDDGLRNFLGNPSQSYPHNVGRGLGTGDSPEILLDKIPDVTPLRAEGLYGLIGKTVCAVVYDSDVSINYSPLNGNLQGENLGTAAFNVLDVVYLPGFSTGTLPRVQIEILDAEEICEQSLNLYLDAPVPPSSSEPYDVKPNDMSDNSGYK